MRVDTAFAHGSEAVPLGDPSSCLENMGQYINQGQNTEWYAE